MTKLNVGERAILKDTMEASVALRDWFLSQEISPVGAVAVMTVLLAQLTYLDVIGEKQLKRAQKHAHRMIEAMNG